jgi:hypothetical protein
VATTVPSAAATTTPTATTAAAASPVIEGAPPVIYTVPSDFHLTISAADIVALASATGAEEIHLIIDTSQEDTTHPLGLVEVGGEQGLVLRDGPTADGHGFGMVVIVVHAGTKYEIACVGYYGYDTSRIRDGCSSFLQSIRFA